MENQPKSTRISWKRIVIALAVILVGLFLIKIPALHIMAWHFTRSFAEEHPKTSLMPQTLLRTSSVDLSNSPKLKAFGWSISVPSSPIPASVTKHSVGVYPLSDGGNVIFFDPAQAVDAAGMYRRTGYSMTSIFRPSELDSQYDFERTALLASPKDISIWNSSLKNVRSMILLTTKSFDVDRASVIYPISSARLRGFQFGDPSVPDGIVTLRLYDDQDHALWFIIRTAKATGWTQEQMNGVIASITPAH